ncbi:hypothetical protein ACFPIJ_33730 [Dactylosporangium cerinum]|uniref:Uncharacterized protein n=1 Tax=Dactylosporangium cerinum TaxID=1434730 RepID=A0ABV9W6Q9_9ACTN
MRPYPKANHFVAGTAAAMLLLTVYTVPDVPCTAGGCGPEPVTSVAVGVAAATAVMSYLHRWAAVCAAVLCAVLWPVADRADDSQLGWRAMLPLALVAVSVGVARLRWEVPPASVVRRQPPAPPCSASGVSSSKACAVTWPPPWSPRNCTTRSPSTSTARTVSSRTA